MIKGWVGSMFVALMIATSVKSSLADWYIIPTGSMEPTILVGDRVFTNKLAYDLKIPYTRLRVATWENPKRGDIVVFNSPVDGTRLIKRVVGIPGDIISMQSNRLTINGHDLKYNDYDNEELLSSVSDKESRYRMYIEDLTGIEHKTMVMPFRNPLDSFKPILVPDDRYLVMGDNRDNSVDSRYFGFIRRKLILGQATAVVISLDLNNYYKPRWSRFFSELL